MDDDEVFGRAYWIKGWHLVIITNERLIFLDTNLNILDKLGQFVTDFFYGAYSFNLVTTSHKDK